MNILLTGSNGFLGSYLERKLSSDFFVCTLSRSNSDVNCDLSKTIPMFNQVFDLVIHAAGLAHVNNNDNCEISDSFYQHNVIGTQNLLLGLERNWFPKKFVFISSVSVYGVNEGDLLNEETPTLAYDSYGKSKLLAEKKILSWCEKNNVSCTILRLPLVVGHNPPGNLKSMVNAIRKGYYFNIERGIARKSMVLISDVGRFIIASSEKAGIYNLTDGHHPSFFELSSAISKTLKVRGKILNMPFWVANFLAIIGSFLSNDFPLNANKLKKMTSTLTFDDSKARMSFGWSPSSVIDRVKDFL